MLRLTLLAIFSAAAVARGEHMRITPLVTTAGDPHSDLYRSMGRPGYEGVALLTIETAGGILGCSGALLAGGLHVLTAAHCVTDESGALDTLSLAATFFTAEGAVEVINAASFLAHPAFTGAVQTGHDVAVVTLEHAPPPSVRRYELYDGGAEIGSTYEVVGFGATGSGDTGYVIDDWERRRGWNTFDATMTETFGSFAGWTGGDAVLVSDFDNGNAGNDALGVFYGIPGLGLGTQEASMAPGDSGAPAFIDSRIAGIASFRLRLRFTDGMSSDVDDIQNASFGEFNAFTRVSSYRDWIRPVPEPGTMALVGIAFAVAAIRGRSRRARGREAFGPG